MTLPVRLDRRRFALLLPLALAACATDLPPPAVYPALDFTYLPKLRLNVSSIDVENAWSPATAAEGRHVEPLAPIQPVVALRQMAQERLIPTGTSGHAVMVIDDASLVEGVGQYQGSMQVHLDISSADGTKSGYARAAVTATRTMTDDSPEAAHAALFALVQRMMTDMNVEFEFQVRRSLRDYLGAAVQTAPLSQPVQTQDLAPPHP